MTARVLYIEDNMDNRVLVRRVLGASDYPLHLEEASNAAEGISLAKGNRPDLILMDLSMPDVDGLTATRQIRSMPELASVPIIALTANVMGADREKTLEAGCSGYIGKPIDVDKFPAELMAYLNRN